MTAVGNETRIAGNETGCLVCGTQLEVRSTGRPRRFCTSAHRVAHHRRLKHLNRGSKKEFDRLAALERLHEGMTDLRPVRQAHMLRRLADAAEPLERLVEEVEPCAWAVDDLDVSDALYRLADARETIARLVELADLADDLASLVDTVRDLRALEHALAEELDEASA